SLDTVREQAVRVVGLDVHPERLVGSFAKLRHVLTDLEPAAAARVEVLRGHESWPRSGLLEGPALALAHAFTFFRLRPRLGLLSDEPSGRQHGSRSARL